jgi:2-hydroxychromene-2-carboxylate isomerase
VTAVEFHFDLLCPWAYQTSKWIREVRQQRDIEVTWRFFSLEEIKWHEGESHPWDLDWSRGWSSLRVAALLRREPDGNDVVDRFYDIAGRMFHEEGVELHTQQGVEAALRGIGRDPALVAEAIADRTTSDDVLADHRRAVDLGVFGVPTLVIDGGDVLYGPVTAPAPTGRAAGRLWDLVVGWAEFPQLYELQRPKSDADWKSIGACFEPYQRARGWSAG